MLLGLVLVALLGLNDMGFFSSDKRDMRGLLGDAGAVLIDDAELAVWQPDPDHKPDAYYVLRELDEAGFRRLAAQLNLTVAANPALDDAIWTLPLELAMPGWSAASIAPGSGLQAQAALGSGNAWLRWHGGTLFLVVLRAS